MNEEKNNEIEMLDEYDFSQAEIGKYAKQYAEGTDIVVLDGRENPKETHLFSPHQTAHALSVSATVKSTWLLPSSMTMPLKRSVRRAT
jgi:hypothetical protein